VALVLIVDDDSFYRKFLRRLLEKAGHTVIEAATGKAGIECYCQHGPNLAIVDFILPDTNGGKVMRSILRLNSSARVVVISSQSAFTDSQFVGLLKQLGATATLCKSDPVEKIVAEITRVVGVLKI